MVAETAKHKVDATTAKTQTQKKKIKHFAAVRYSPIIK